MVDSIAHIHRPSSPDLRAQWPLRDCIHLDLVCRLKQPLDCLVAVTHDFENLIRDGFRVPVVFIAFL